MRLFVFFLSVLGATGCAGLDGDWSGVAECESGLKFKTEASIDRIEGREYSMDTRVVGAVSCITGAQDEEAPCDLRIAGEIVSDEQYGEQGINITFDECKAVSSEGSTPGACIDPSNATWDGADSMKMETELFGLLCRIELDRD
jgi:hypothetical protein